MRLKGDDLQVDLRVLPDEDFATALHHFTGSKAHHLRLRALAQDKGLTISEWGVHRWARAPKKGARARGAEEKLPIKEEQDLYAAARHAVVPPELREDWGEVEAALAHTLPTDLVTQADLVGNVHSHTTWSDGKNSLLEMAQAAQALGLEYLTVTEHSQTSGYAGGLKPDDLKRQWDEIDALNAKLKGFRLLKGIESDILEDGSLDYPDALLEKLDLVIGSIHQRHSQNEEQMTKRVLTAMDNPFFMIWGHPTGAAAAQARAGADADGGDPRQGRREGHRDRGERRARAARPARRARAAGAEARAQALLLDRLALGGRGAAESALRGRHRPKGLGAQA